MGIPPSCVGPISRNKTWRGSAVNNPSAENDNCTIKDEWSDMGLYLFVRNVKHVDGGRVLLIVISLYENKTVIWTLQL